MEDQKLITFQAPKEFWERLKFHTVKNSTSMREVIIEAVNNYLKTKTTKS